jgi:hypothetical protein
MDGGVADADAPDLGIGVAGQQALGGVQGIFRHLEVAGVHVEDQDLAVITGFHLRTHALLVKGCAAAAMLLFAVAGLGFRHCSSPVRREGHALSPIVAIGRATCSSRTTQLSHRVGLR